MVLLRHGGIAPAHRMVYKAINDAEGNGTGSSSNLIQALEDAVADGADVINNSWEVAPAIRQIALTVRPLPQQKLPVYST